MRVLVTGGAGFIGSHVCDALFSAGHSVFCFDDFSTGRPENIPEVMKGGFLCSGNVAKSEDVEGVIGVLNVDAIVHLAAQAAISTSIKDPEFDLAINALGTMNVVKSAKKFRVKNLVFSSTSAVYDENFVTSGPILENVPPLRPSTPYGISKLAAEGYVRTIFPESVILRFGNVYGPRQVPIGENQVLSRMIRHFKYGDKFYIHGNGNQRRDFIYVSDVVSAVLASLEGKPGTYNVATGESHSVNEIAKIVESYYGAEGYNWDHTEEEDPRRNVCLDISAAQSNLWWEPKVKFKDGIVKTIDWWQEFGEK